MSPFRPEEGQVTFATSSAAWVRDWGGMRRGVWQGPGVGGGKGLDLTAGSINSRCHHSHHHCGFGSKLLGLKSHSAIYYIAGLVTQLHLILETPWDVECQAPLSLGIFQARLLEWVAISFSSGPSRLRN